MLQREVPIDIFDNREYIVAYYKNNIQKIRRIKGYRKLVIDDNSGIIVITTGDEFSCMVQSRDKRQNETSYGKYGFQIFVIDSKAEYISIDVSDEVTCSC